MGDAINAMAVAQYIATLWPQVHLVCANKTIEHCMRPPNTVDMTRSDNHHVYFLSTTHSVKKPITLHPIEYMMMANNLVLPSMPKPWFAPFQHVVIPVYDYVIAPYSNDSQNREMPGNVLTYLVNKLSPAKIAIIGAISDHTRACLLPLKAELYMGRALGFVLELMHAAKHVITVDSGPSRLAYCAPIRDHVIVAPTPELPAQWVGYPGATVVRSWDVNAILTALRPG